MTYSFPPDLKHLVDTRMASGKYASEDEVLRDALAALAAECAELEAIETPIEEWRAGDPGVPLADAFADVRRRHNIASDA